MGNFAPDWVQNDDGEYVDRWSGTPKPPDPKPFKMRMLSKQEQITDLQIKVHLLEQQVDKIMDLLQRQGHKL